MLGLMQWGGDGSEGECRGRAAKDSGDSVQDSGSPSGFSPQEVVNLGRARSWV